MAVLRARHASFSVAAIALVRAMQFLHNARMKKKSKKPLGDKKAKHVQTAGTKRQPSGTTDGTTRQTRAIMPGQIRRG